MKYFSRLIHLALVLIILCGSLLSGAPVAAAPPGEAYWRAQSTPGLDDYLIYNGSNGTDFAECAATGRIYLLDRGKAVVKTGTKGSGWESTATIFGWTSTAVAVAPDDEDQIVVVNAATNTLVISGDRGNTWMTLPALPTAQAAARIMDVAVGPARAGTLLGREYAIALADPTGNATATATMQGGVLIIGSTTTWSAVAGTTGAADFYSLRFSPGYLSDRILIAASADAAPIGEVGYWLLNTATDAALAGYGPAVVTTAAAPNDLGASAAVKQLDIALPVDFNPMLTPRAYLGVGSWLPVASDDVYRLDASVSTDLDALNPAGAAVFIGVESIGYSGTQAQGTLFCGYVRAGATRVKRSVDAATASPNWVDTVNPPSGSNGILVRPALDFAQSQRVFALTTGTGSAWSTSTDAGVSFHQTSWIDNGVANDWVHIESLAITADGERFWCVTDDGTDLSVWEGPAPPNPAEMRRLYYLPGAGDGNTTTAEVHLNPDWAASPTAYLVDRSVVPSAIYVSNNAGSTWAARGGPGTAALNLITVVNRDTLYAVIAGKLHISHNQGWTWEPPVTWNISYQPGQGSLQVTADGSIFIADNSIRRSPDASPGSWVGYGTHGLSGDNIYAVVHPDWQEKGLAYVCDSVTGRVLRLDPAGDTFLDTGYTPTSANACLKMQFQNDVLYVITPDGVWRNPEATADIATMRAGWQGLNIGANSRAHATAPGTGFGGTATTAVMHQTAIYINGGDDGPIGPLGTLPANNLEDLWGLVDATVAIKPLIEAPTNGQVISVDPVTGRAVPVTLRWSPLGQGQGQVTRWDIRVWEKAAGVHAATTLSGITPATVTRPVVSSSSIVAWPVMLPDAAYLVQLRGSDTAAGANLTTAWSDPVGFSVQSWHPLERNQLEIEILSPQGGAVTGTDPGFTWVPSIGATSYRLTVATDAALIQTVAGTPVEVDLTSYQASGLEPGTTYFWAVMVIEPRPGTPTIGTFTTADAPGAVPTSTPEILIPAPAAPEVIIEIPTGVNGGGLLPDAAVWAIVGIGAVLVLAVLILVVAVVILVVRTGAR